PGSSRSAGAKQTNPVGLGHSGASMIASLVLRPYQILLTSCQEYVRKELTKSVRRYYDGPASKTLHHSRRPSSVEDRRYRVQSCHSLPPKLIGRDVPSAVIGRARLKGYSITLSARAKIDLRDVTPKSFAS